MICAGNQARTIKQGTQEDEAGQDEAGRDEAMEE
jgi:hypothetical protein